MNNRGEFCTNCGSPLTASARFCEKCGKPVVSTRVNPDLASTGSGQTGSRKTWWVCGSLAGLAAFIFLCFGGAAFLYWQGMFPFSEFQKKTGNIEILPPEPTEKSGNITATVEIIAPTITQAPTQVSTPQNSPLTPEAGPKKIAFDGISFFYDPELANNVYGINIPAVSGTADTVPWEVMPSYVEFSFENYPLQGTFHDPIIMVFPLEEYYASGQTPKEMINRLKHLIETKDDNPSKAIPFLPVWNAGQTIHAAVKYLDFKNGSGVRFLTQYGQDISPINNNSVFYSYQGITADNLYYVSAILPVSSAILPADSSEIPGGDYTAFSNIFESYIKETAQKLTAEKPDSFIPDLNLLDKMIQSLEVKPE